METLDERQLAEVPIVVLDTETTGLSPELGHRVIEIAAVRLVGWQETERFAELVNPGRPIDAGAARVHGLTDADVAGAPPFSRVAKRLSLVLDEALIVAHNASFDAGFLAMEYTLASREGVCAPSLPNPWLCTLRLARRQFHFGRNNLTSIADRLGVRRSRAHRALNDVYTTLGVLRSMVKELERRKLYTVGDLLHAQGGPIYMQPVPAALLPPPLGAAMAGAKQVRIVYVTSQGTQTRRVISPLYTTAAQGSSYLVAYCHLRHAQRTFRLDRILNVELIDQE
jgi:DNA polymerase III subunit epsilon